MTEPIHRLSRNGVLLGAAIITIAVQAAMAAIPPLADAFRAQPLDAIQWALVALVALGPALVAQAIRARTHAVWVG